MRIEKNILNSKNHLYKFCRITKMIITLILMENLFKLKPLIKKIYHPLFKILILMFQILLN